MACPHRCWVCAVEGSPRVRAEMCLTQGLIRIRVYEISIQRIMLVLDKNLMPPPRLIPTIGILAGSTSLVASFPQLRGYLVPSLPS